MANAFVSARAKDAANVKNGWIKTAAVHTMTRPGHNAQQMYQSG